MESKRELNVEEMVALTKTFKSFFNEHSNAKKERSNKKMVLIYVFKM